MQTEASKMRHPINPIRGVGKGRIRKGNRLIKDLFQICFPKPQIRFFKNRIAAYAKGVPPKASMSSLATI